MQELIGWGQFLHERITREVAQRILPQDIDQPRSKRKIVKDIVTISKAVNNA